MSALADSKTEKIVQIIRRIHQSKIENLLVVGCGEGIEAAILAQQLKVRVTGIDIENHFDAEAAKYAALLTGDAMNLAFDNDSFDFVFSYHALEHIENPQKALEEIKRVLKPNGGFWIGTPNKSRIIGYLNGKNTSFDQKVQWNIADWKARLQGRFENNLGAHAGFTSSELQALLSDVFQIVEDRTSEYFSTIYANHRQFLSLIESSGLSHFLYPCIYFSGRK